MKYFAIVWALLVIAGRDGRAQEKNYFVAHDRKINIKMFNRQIEQMLSDVGAPGASIAIIDNNKVVFAKGYGSKHASRKEPVDDTTVFEACSISKTYVSYVAFKMVDEGKLDLNKPLYQYLENPQLAHDPRYKLITARMVLSHSSGVENWKWDNNPKELEILANPGETYVYSGAAYTYLADVLEVILKMPYEEYVRQLILEPFGLRNTFTTFKVPNIPSDYAVGSSVTGKENQKWKNKEPWPAAGVNVCAGDYARFLVNAFQHLSDSAKKYIATPIVRISKANPRFYFGMGFAVAYPPSDTIVNFEGNNVGFKVFIAYSIVHKRGFAVFSNYDLGQLMARRVNDLTVALDIDPCFDGDTQPQYPSPAFSLLKIYRYQGWQEMFREIDKRRQRGNDKNLCRTINGLTGLLFQEGDSLRKGLLEYNIKYNPKDPTAYYLLGQIYRNQQRYALAIEYFTKSKDLHYNAIQCDNDIADCKRMVRG
jgi:CubicO group peptidase (beta-lactamase class C family)